MQEIKESGGLYGLLLERLENVRRTCHKEIVPYPLIFSCLCRSFSMKKEKGWEILFFLRDLGLIEIVTGQIGRASCRERV